MAEEIKDGTGTGYLAQVDQNNQLHTFSVTEDESQQATSDGNAWNLNTGDLTISASSAILYFKNDEDTTFVLDAIAVGISNKNGDGSGLPLTDTPTIILNRNPTGGTIVDNAVDVAQKQNRNGNSFRIKWIN